MTMVQIYAASRMPLRMPRRHFLAGLDGRAEFALSGAAGGEIGELVVAVLALERARAEVLSAFTQNDEIEEKSTVRVNLDRDEIRALVVSYVKWLHSSGAQKFYMGTDSITIRRWAAAAGAPVNLLSHGDALSSAMETSESAVASIPLDVRERMVRLCKFIVRASFELCSSFVRCVVRVLFECCSSIVRCHVIIQLRTNYS